MADQPAGRTTGAMGGVWKVAGLLVLAALVVVLAILIAADSGGSSDTNERWIGHLAAALLLVLFTVLISRGGASPRDLLVGDDGRVSTGKTQAFLWTYALALALLSLVLANWFGATKGFDNLTKTALKDEYLILLGGPFAAAVFAKGIVTAKVADGTAVKTEGTPAVDQVAKNDLGRLDLVDTQYLLFNLVTLTYFFGTFFNNPDGGLPNLPEILVGLTGAAAGVYVANKAVSSDPPTITAITPPRAKVGDTLTLFTKALVLETLGDDGRTRVPSAPIVEVDGVAAPNVTLGTGTGPGQHQVKVVVPTLTVTADRVTTVQAYRANGTVSNAFQITLIP